MSATPRLPGSRLRPTRTCLTLALVLLAIQLAAVNYHSNLTWLLGLLIAAMAVVSIHHARRNLAGLGATVGDPGPLFAGDAVRLPLTLANAGAQPAAGIAVHLAEHPGAPLVGLLVPVGGLLAADLVLPPLPRGVHQLGALRLHSLYPMGMVLVWRDLPDAAQVVVYPRPAGGPLAADGQRSGGQGGGGGPGSDDFHGHRRHQPGDSHRQVDWKAEARDRPLLVKHYTGSGLSEIRLDWRDTAGDDEARLSQLARWALDAHRQGRRFSLALPAGRLPADTGDQHLRACLRHLAAHPGLPP